MMPEQPLTLTGTPIQQLGAVSRELEPEEDMDFASSDEADAADHDDGDGDLILNHVAPDFHVC